MIFQQLRMSFSSLRRGFAIRRFYLSSVFCAGLVFLASGNLNACLAYEAVDAVPVVKFNGLRHYSLAFVQLPVAVQATDDLGITKIEFYVDGLLVGTNNVIPSLPTVTANFPWSATPVGKHIIQAKAFDTTGNTQTTSVVVLARNLAGPTGNSISLNPAIRHQTMVGWEADAQAGQWDSPAFNNYKNGLYDSAVNDLGINRIRLEITSGSENPTDYFAQWRAGTITAAQYNAKRYEIINDNADPNSVNAAGFKWSQLDDTINNVVIPIRQRLQARGETLWINLNYVDFGSSTFEHKANPTEYAEFMLATYQHMQTTFGFVPDSWEIILEPDTASANWNPTQVAQVIKAGGDRLAANNITMPFTAPSVTDISNGPAYIAAIVSTTGAMPYVGELSYHRYAGAPDVHLTSIVNTALQYNKKTAMLEWISAEYGSLHQDLKKGRNSSWQQFTLAFPNQPDNGAQYYTVSDANPNAPVVSMGSRTKLLRQYFKFIRFGAQRIEATSANINFDPLAFINANGKYVVVVKAEAGGNFDVRGLPPAVYGIKYTTFGQYNIDLPDVTITAGQSLPANIPSTGVITVYAK